VGWRVTKTDADDSQSYASEKTASRGSVKLEAETGKGIRAIRALRTGATRVQGQKVGPFQLKKNMGKKEKSERLHDLKNNIFYEEQEEKCGNGFTECQ